MKCLKIAVCDDDSRILKQMENIFDSYRKYQLEIFYFDKGENLILDFKRNQKYNIVFLDIELNTISGIDVAQNINRISPNIIFFFITSYTDYIPEAFKIRAFQFLLKPLDTEIIINELERAIKYYFELHNKFTFQKGYEKFCISFCDIIYYEAYGGNIKIVTTKGFYYINGNIKNLYNSLPDYFIRCHQGYIVNMRFIYKLTTNEIITSDLNHIPLSKRMRKNVLSKFNIYLAECSL